MTINFARYEIEKGYIHNWLVAGPQAIPVVDLDNYRGEDWKLQIARHYDEADSGVTSTPLENEPLQISDLAWNYYRCDDDHFVDCTAFYHICHYLRSWAYTRVVAPTAQQVQCILTTNGPADVWLNGAHVHRHEHFYHQIPNRVSFSAALNEGQNEFLVRFEEVAARECPYVMALQIIGLPQDAFIFIPTGHERIARRQAVEKAINAAYLDRDWFVGQDKITVHWSPHLAQTADLTVRLQKPNGWIYAEGHPSVSAGFRLPLSAPIQIPEGAYEIFLLPTLPEYYEGNLRIEHKIALTATKNEFAEAPYGTIAERSAEALQDAARREQNVFSEVAKMALGQWAEVKGEVIFKTIDGINQREDCSDFYLVGLLGMLCRFGDDPNFPETLKGPLQACVLNFRYWADEPGADSMWFWSENHQILFHACEILAGQLYPDRLFANVGQTGQWHREKGERLARVWLQKRGTGGFSEWDSNCYFEEDLLALSHLADLAESQAIYELATVVMDKLFLTMALNSYKGVFGSTHGRTYTPHIKGARGEATSGVSRLMFGMGAFNDKIMATVSLACTSDYEFPLLIGDIAADLPYEMWNRERHGGTFELEIDRAAGAWDVNKVTYKTPDYMLCSAQDHRPGAKGVQQHIWQATLSPDAVVFVTHPACQSQENSHRPGCWHGNVILPRVAQWKDMLIAVHKFPADDWMGFTHAYFPTWAFDEYTLRGGWAFARKGEGYLALAAARGLELSTHGDNAMRELRSYGHENIWICHMGRAALDGSFNAFQLNILALALAVQHENLSVRCDTLRGETLEFGWQGEFKRNGQPEPLSGFKHYDNPYCVADFPASQMDVRYGDTTMRLKFADA